MNTQQLKEAYDNMTTLSDMTKVVSGMTTQQKHDVLKAHELVKATTGLDMRQEMFLRLME